jgi:hypothetical protein
MKDLLVVSAAESNVALKIADAPLRGKHGRSPPGLFDSSVFVSHPSLEKLIQSLQSRSLDPLIECAAHEFPFAGGWMRGAKLDAEADASLPFVPGRMTPPC